MTSISRYFKLAIALAAGIEFASTSLAELPDGFDYCHHVIPTLHTDLKYATTDNFTNDVVAGYNHSICILTHSALHQLFHIQNHLSNMGLGIKILDAYRPKKAVDAFLSWKTKPNDSVVRARFYPEVTKEELFDMGYIAEHSSHSRGSTIDITIVDLSSGKELGLWYRV